MLDSHKTPRTPPIPENISLITKSAPSTPKVSGGRWFRFKHGYRTTPLYSPPSIEVAKRFLKTVGGAKLQLPPKHHKCPTDTPVSSKLTFQDPEVSMICHGCRGLMVDGLQQARMFASLDTLSHVLEIFLKMNLGKLVLQTTNLALSAAILALSRPWNQQIFCHLLGHILQLHL